MLSLTALRATRPFKVLRATSHLPNTTTKTATQNAATSKKKKPATQPSGNQKKIKTAGALASHSTSLTDLLRESNSYVTNQETYNRMVRAAMLNPAKSPWVPSCYSRNQQTMKTVKSEMRTQFKIPANSRLTILDGTVYATLADSGVPISIVGAVQAANDPLSGEILNVGNAVPWNVDPTASVPNNSLNLRTIPGPGFVDMQFIRSDRLKAYPIVQFGNAVSTNAVSAGLDSTSSSIDRTPQNLNDAFDKYSGSNCTFPLDLGFATDSAGTAEQVFAAQTQYSGEYLSMALPMFLASDGSQRYWNVTDPWNQPTPGGTSFKDALARLSSALIQNTSDAEVTCIVTTMRQYAVLVSSEYAYANAESLMDESQMRVPIGTYRVEGGATGSTIQEAHSRVSQQMLTQIPDGSAHDKAVNTVAAVEHKTAPAKIHHRGGGFFSSMLHDIEKVGSFAVKNFANDALKAIPGAIGRFAAGGLSDAIAATGPVAGLLMA